MIFITVPFKRALIRVSTYPVGTVRNVRIPVGVCI